MKPSIGRIVLVHGKNHNGSFVHPAIITRVWSDTYINVLLMPDACAPYTLTSVSLFDKENYGTNDAPVAYWPPIVDDGKKSAQEASKKTKE